MIVSMVEQGSPEWLTERAGRVSASKFGLILTPGGKKTTGETRAKYLCQLAGERISGQPEESFQSEWMARGNEIEPLARDHFERMSGLFVAQVGMVYLDEKRTISCSPDGLVGDDSGLEIKCPKLSTHIGYLRGNALPVTYIPQVQGSMMVTGRETWNFLSFHPLVAELHKLVERDVKYCEILREAVEEFDAEVSALAERLGNRPSIDVRDHFRDATKMADTTKEEMK